MHAYVAHHLAQAHMEHLRQYRQSGTPDGDHPVPPRRQKLHLRRRGPSTSMYAGPSTWPLQTRLW